MGGSQRPPSRVEARARCKAALSSAHHLRRQPASAARRTAGGARSARRRTTRSTKPHASGPHRPPVSQARTTTWLRSAVATERSNERGVAAQRFAQARGAVKNKIQAAPVLRADAWRGSVGQPLLRDNPALGSQTFTRDADPRLFKQGGPTARCAGTLPHGCPRHRARRRTPGTHRLRNTGA